MGGRDVCDAAGGKRLLWTLDTSDQQLCLLANNNLVHTTQILIAYIISLPSEKIIFVH